MPQAVAIYSSNDLRELKIDRNGEEELKDEYHYIFKFKNECFLETFFPNGKFKGDSKIFGLY